MANLGDITLRLLLETGQGQQQAKLLGGTLQELNTEATKTEQALNETTATIQTKTVNAFKSLLQEIRLAKANVLEFGANTKVAGDESKTYGDVLQDLTKKKQVLMLQTKMTSQQLVSMAGKYRNCRYGYQESYHGHQES